LCNLLNNRAQRKWTAVFRWSAATLLTAGLASSARAEVGIITGPGASETVNGWSPAGAVEGALDRVGVAHRRVDTIVLSERTLRPFEVVVVPSLKLSAAAYEALRHYKDRGGRWVVYQTAGPASFDALLGLKASSLPPPPTDLRAIVPTARLGMPSRVPLSSRGAPRAVEAIDASFNAGRWEVGYGAAALIRGPHGYYVNTAPDSGPGHSDLLLAMLGDLEPLVWTEAQRGTRRAAWEAVEEAAARWTALRRKPEMTAAQRTRIESRLRGRRAEIPPNEDLPPEIEGNRVVLAERVRAALTLRDEVLRLTYEMVPARKGEVRGVAITPSSRQDWETWMRKARDAGMNAVFVNTSDGGGVIYPSEVATTAVWAKDGTDEMALATDSCRRNGLSFHAGRTAFDVTSLPKAQYDKLAGEDRLVRDTKGKQSPYLNPGDPRNIDLEVATILEVVRKYDIDGFHLAGAGYPSDAQNSWDYGPVSRREFEKAKGAVERWPDDVVSGARKQQYEDWERDTINRFVQRVYGEIKKAKAHIQVSVSVGRERAGGRAAQKCDWPLWAAEGWVDFIIPRNDSTAVDLVAASVEEQVSAARGRVPVVAGLGASQLRSSALLLQLEAAREQGADGFVLFELGTPAVDEQLTALRAGATAEGTWPGYLAPKVSWVLEPILERPDLPWAIMIGERAHVEIKVVGTSPLRQALKGITAELRLEDAEGRLLQSVGAVAAFGVRKFRFQAPAGRFRPVLRGNMVLADGNSRPFVLRGPLCDGVSPDELAVLKAQEQPPAINGAGRKVAVFAGGEGADRLLQTFTSGLNMIAFPVYRLQPEHLTRVDVLVISAATDVADLSPTVVQGLRQWVTNGGTLLLTHDAVGARWHPRMFAEVAVAAEPGAAESLEVLKQLGEVKQGALLPVSSGLCVWRLKTASGVEVMVREAGEQGEPIAVAGTVGKGRVIMYGGAPGAGGSPILGPEQELLWGLIEAR
jgi:uncharacterized lipoprotein YddW (UPF0748 family)